MAEFPDAIYTPRETENLPGLEYNPAQKTMMFSEDFQNLGAEINAIENILGTNPEGSESTVGDRIAGIGNSSVDFSSTINPVGWSGTPTINYARYIKIGKLVFVEFSINGTSNAVTASVTLPFAHGLAVAVSNITRIANNGADAVGLYRLNISSTTCDFGATVGAIGNFTASGTKVVRANFCYISA